MRLKLTPAYSTKTVQISLLTADGEPVCHILEDPVRQIKDQPPSYWKIPGQTAIPAGIYSIVVNYSPRFRQVLPLLENVPGFSGIRIHPGNSPDDSEGCLLPGTWNGGDRVSDSRKAFASLVLLLDKAFKRGETVTIEVIR